VLTRAGSRFDAVIGDRFNFFIARPHEGRKEDKVHVGGPSTHRMNGLHGELRARHSNLLMEPGFLTVCLLLWARTTNL